MNNLNKMVKYWVKAIISITTVTVTFGTLNIAIVWALVKICPRITSLSETAGFIVAVVTAVPCYLVATKIAQRVYSDTI